MFTCKKCQKDVLTSFFLHCGTFICYLTCICCWINKHCMKHKRFNKLFITGYAISYWVLQYWLKWINNIYYDDYTETTAQKTNYIQQGYQIFINIFFMYILCNCPFLPPVCIVVLLNLFLPYHPLFPRETNIWNGYSDQIP